MQSATDAARPMPDKDVSRYVIDAGRSTFTVQAYSTGVLSVFGHNPKIAIRDLQGEAQFAAPGGTLEDVQLHVRIGAASLQVIDDISDKDKREIQRQMYDEVLEVDRFPEIVYECSQVTASGTGDRYWVALSGELTLHGETHPQSVSARVVISGDNLRASGEFPVKQSEYAIAPVTVAGGAIKLKDEIKCTFDIVARKQG